MKKRIVACKSIVYHMTALVLALLILSLAACQTGNQGYGSNPEAIAFNETGIDLYNKGAFEKALLNFDRALEKDPSNPAVHFNKGQALDAMKNFQQAVISYDQAIKLDPDFADAWNYRGISYLNLKEYDKALESVDKAISISGNSAFYWESKGQIYQAQDKYQEAVPCYARAASLDSANVDF